ncbi:MAM and LDL-receptor class A domain-containing protein 1-like isoform X3 [Crassostrea angulata]|uniref:MAM and LDL-receptor class A domain-containing protein 1-like isoform X3 n=1 Tax=Magallana angulata TaxID=2784310 RepID=UPI0022B125E6|nr:MAM and LDL-receptor class A domain-containing protein 1-like isoform X3 [Crassostrea angulata]
MGLIRPAVVLLLLLIVLCIAGHAVDKHNGRVMGKREARIVLNELRKRHASHVLKRSADSEIEEEADINLAMIDRELERFEDTLRSNEDKGANQHEAESGEKLIQEALKGNVDPNSGVVNLLESMFVDEGSRHNQHPNGIENIASKKGKVFGDSHDGHRWTRQQIEELNQNGGRKRNFVKSATLWTDNIIPYTIDSSLSRSQRNVDVINKAIQQFTDYTCLKWVPYGSAEANKLSHSTYIEFFSGSGCWSYVGRVFSGKQQVSLQDPGCVSVSTTVHEMGHAIGQHHEQSRSDRDNYVTMLWGNIRGGRSNNNMAKSNTYDRNPYDYESVLQYSLRSFSSNGQPTIEFKDRRLDFLADSATGLMFYDIQDIVDAYNCTETCRGADGNTPLKQCQNGGFVLHTCNCHCPDGLTGDLCQSVRTDPECGPGIIDLADGESRTITSPNFNNGGPYPTGKECVWLVKVMPGKFVKMTIEEMDLTTARSACDHWLEIQYNLIGQTGPRRCGKVRKETYVTALHGNPTLMLLKFDSAFASTATAGKGFNLTVSSMGGGCRAMPCMYGKCTEVGSDDYTCSCESGFSGKHCDTYSGTGDIFCGFETPNCLFRNPPSNSYIWIITSGSTKSSGTGPSGAKTGSRYLYVETSSPVPSGALFQFESPYFLGGPRCLSFWYHMYGSDMGTLSVSRNGTQLWTKTGDQGNTWHWIQMNVGTSSQTFKVTLEAVKGKGYKSDIAIDDVTLTSGMCTGITPSPATQNPTTPSPVTSFQTTLYPVTSFQTTLYPVTSFPTTQTSSPPVVDQDLHCTFETGTSCFLNNINNDDFDWQIQRGQTPSRGTGPSSAYEGQLYSYIEASGKRKDDVAILESQYGITTTTFCLSFAYHMYGTKIGSLRVEIESPNGDQILFSKQYAQGNKWIVTSVDVPPSNGKIRFIGVRGKGFCGDIAIDDIHFVNGSCNTEAPFTTTPMPSTLPLSCTFETGTKCFLKDAGSDDFDWTVRSGKTPSSKTGPSKAAEGIKYAYIEASQKKPGVRATLEGIVQMPKDGDMCLSFNYHMYGETVDSLEVLFQDMSHFHEVGNKGDQWNKAEFTLFNLDSTVAPKIQFTATRGSNYKSDIAIDNVQLTEGECVIDCTSNPCSPNSLCVQETSTTYRCDCRPDFTGVLCDVVLGQANCTFEKGEDCFLENSTLDDFDWHRKSGRTPSSKTGPGSAKQGSWYAYIEASGRRPGQKAVFVSKYMFESGERCLTFAYHMYGNTIGSLKVLQETNMNTMEVFSKSGEQSNSYSDWKTASLDIYHHMNDTIVFEATRGKSYSGDIALDDIKYTPGRCACDLIVCKNGGTCVNKQNGGFCQCPPQFTGNRCEKKMGLLASCTFDDGSCFLTDITGLDSMDWKITKKRTPSSRTGPGKPLDGNYAYIEASGRRSGDNAILTSAVMSQLSPSGPSCLRFFYNMNGRDMGTLEVFAGERNSKQKVWSISGNQNDKWNPVGVDILPANDLVIMIEAIRGKSYRSDIAIDTIELFDSPCSAGPQPT